VDGSLAASPPPLTRRQSTWRYLVAVVSGMGFWTGALLTYYDGKLTALLALDLVLGGACIVQKKRRRTHPLVVAVIVNGAASFSTFAAGPASVVTVSLATRRRWREILTVAAVTIVANLVYFRVHEGSDTLLSSLLFSAVFVSALNPIGMYVGARRDLAATRQERVDRAEREQELRIEQAQATERNRIAREMHDVLAHRLSLVAMHAGALSYRRGLTDDEVAESADVIRSNAHHALADLRDILGVLRTAEGGADPDPPQPTLVDLPALLTEALAAGTRVRLHNLIGDLAQPPEAIGRSAYRMVQESLTNARKHAPDTTVDVLLSGGPGSELLLEVRNPIRVGAVASTTPGSGLGLVGLTERAELIGGRLEHTTSGTEFVVRAWLPWPA